MIARTNDTKLPSPWTYQLEVSMNEICQRAAAARVGEAAIIGWRFGGNEPHTVVSNNYR